MGGFRTDSFTKHLKSNEDEATTRIMAFMSFNPSIGRVLETGSVAKFEELCLRVVGDLHKVKSLEDFDIMHHKHVRYMRKRFKTARGKKVSYGQAQKPLNVFLKVYVDRSGRPNREISKRLRPYLHVPLDSVLMKAIRKEYPEEFGLRIRPHIESAGQAFSLSRIDRRLYLEWQKLFREKYSARPVLSDVAWALNRRKP